MALLDFQTPEKIIMIESDNFHGKFEFRPLEPGYGITIGNAIRRILLSSLEGFAITSVKIEGVSHEFSTIKGVVEDVVEIVLNLKQIRLRQEIEDINSEKFTVVIKNQEVLTAGDLAKFTSSFQVLNPELVICHLEPSVKLSMEFTIEKGRGYVPAEEQQLSNKPLGTLSIDAIFTPITNVKYTIENYRVEQKTDYEKLIIDITTDGSIHPKETLKEAAKILIYHFMLFSDDKITLETHLGMGEGELDESSLHVRQLLKTKLLDLDLSVRALNCLKAADVETLANLVVLNKNELLKFRNFGKKSLVELEELIEVKGLSFGMDISKYKLDDE